MDYVFHVLILSAVYASLAVSLSLLVGHAGLLSLAHAAFFGLGAYTSSLLSLHFHLPFLVTAPAAILAGVVLSFLIAVPSLRLRDDYFVIATFGFQIVIVAVINNWIDLTGGPLGIRGIPRPALAGLGVSLRTEFVALSLLFLGLTAVIVWRITRQPLGRVLRALREDEIFTASLGKNVFGAKIVAFAVSCALAAGAGTIYAHYISYIDPSSFGISESILIISMVIIGGAGSRWGPILGAVVLVSLPELLRIAGIPGPVAANLRQIVYGVLLVLMMWYRPAGLVRARAPLG